MVGRRAFRRRIGEVSGGRGRREGARGEEGKKRHAVVAEAGGLVVGRGLRGECRAPAGEIAVGLGALAHRGRR